MRILQIINNLGSGGAEKLISDLSPLIASKGHHIEILLLQEKSSIYINDLRREGINVTCLSKSSLYSFLHIWKIFKYIQKGKFDIIHVHVFPALYFVAIATLLGVENSKLCFTEHNTKNRRMSNKLFQIIDRWIYKFYNTIICITDDVKYNIQSHLNNDGLKYVTVCNGVNLVSFESLISKDAKTFISTFSGKKIVTMVARFSEQKDHATLINSMKFLSENIHLLLIGEGSLKASMNQMAKQLCLSDRIHFLGLRKDVPDILRLSDIGVLSSNWEGFGLAAVEKMAAGIPVIVSDVPGISSVVGNAGILFKKGNAKELASHINQLLNEPEYYAQRAAACKKQAQEYSIEKMVDGYLNVYEQMLNEN